MRLWDLGSGPLIGLRLRRLKSEVRENYRRDVASRDSEISRNSCLANS